MKKCIVSLQVSSPVAYANDPSFARLNRLEQSLKQTGFSGDFLAWRGNYPPGAPSHLVSPWGFKPFCLMEAQNAGYDLALWLDSSAVVLRSIDPLFEVINNTGYVIFKNQDYIWGEWCSDEVLSALTLDREESFDIPEVNGAVIGLKFSNVTASKFLGQWHQWAAEGSIFRGSKEYITSAEEFDAIKWNTGNKISSHPRVRGHRHDQTGAGILAYRLSMALSDEMVTESYNKAYANKRTTILIERRTDISLFRIRTRLCFIERIKAVIRRLLKWTHVRRTLRLSGHM